MLAPSIEPRYDVIIVGAGISGLLMAAILCRHGHRVLVIERDVHPRFAIGESGIKETSLTLSLMGLRFDVPEIRNLSSVDHIRRFIGPSSGQKRSFSFLWHAPGEPHQPEHSVQVGSPRLPFGFDSHMFRQDIDAYLLGVAASYGATILQGVSVETVHVDADEAIVEIAGHGTARGRFVLDGAGYRSPLARQFNLHEQPCPFETQSRSIFNHFVSVPAYDDRVASNTVCGLAQRMGYGTLHHVFHGGWLWVIPFNNVADPINPLCSVGALLDPAIFPATGQSPEAEWAALLARYPSVQAHLGDARPVRPWVTTPRIQFRQRQAIGRRWALLPHAVGFIDALFSRGLYATAAGVNELAGLLLAALAENDFEPARFQPYSDLIYNTLKANDRVVSTSYASWVHFDLWNAWHRVWGLGVFLESVRLVRAHARFRETGDRRWLDNRQPSPMASLPLDLPGYRALFDAAERLVKSGLEQPEAAAQAIFRLLADSPVCPPSFRYGEPRQRFLDMTDPRAMAKVFWWVGRRSPPEIRQFIDFRPSSLLGELVDDQLRLRWWQPQRLARR